MTVDMAALVIFTDVRGFTKWSEANEVFVNLDRFVSGFLRILRQRFPGPRYEDEHGRMRLLVARRTLERRLYPGKLEGCGGQLRYSGTFTEGVHRHFWQEMNLDVEVLEQFHVFYAIREPNEPVIPGIRFLCRRVGSGEPKSTNHSERKIARVATGPAALSAELGRACPILIPRGGPRPWGSELKWLTESEFRRMPASEFVGNLKREVIQLLESYKKATPSVMHR